jgi:hypothetical protein
MFLIQYSYFSDKFEFDFIIIIDFFIFTLFFIIANKDHNLNNFNILTNFGTHQIDF